MRQKTIVDLFLDESGNCLSQYFVVGGFYMISTGGYSDLQRNYARLTRDIKNIENDIKKYRLENEPHLEQYYKKDEVSKNSFYNKEVKWNGFSVNNKLFLSSKIKNRNQRNVSIICDIKNWKTKLGRPINIDFVYNYMVHILVKSIYKKYNLIKYKEVIFRINIDQRKDIPKDQGTKNKVKGLNEYVSTNLILHDGFTNVSLNVFNMILALMKE